MRPQLLNPLFAPVTTLPGVGPKQTFGSAELATVEFGLDFHTQEHNQLATPAQSLRIAFYL